MNNFYMCENCGFRINNTKNLELDMCPKCKKSKLIKTKGKKFKKGKPYTSKRMSDGTSY